MERKIKNGQVLKFSFGENVFVVTLETIVKLLIRLIWTRKLFSFISWQF